MLNMSRGGGCVSVRPRVAIARSSCEWSGVKVTRIWIPRWPNVATAARSEGSRLSRTIWSAASRARMTPVGVENVRSNKNRNCRRAEAWTSGPASAPAGVSAAASTSRNATSGTFLPWSSNSKSAAVSPPTAPPALSVTNTGTATTRTSVPNTGG